jgi:hypothetical protein
MKRIRQTEARRILTAYCEKLTGKPPSTFKITKERNENGKSLNWWMENRDAVDSWDGPRSRAYLQAYVEIAGPIFFGSGIPLHDGFLQPDRGVMKRLFEAGAVTLDEKTSKIIINNKGRELIGSVLEETP